MDEEVDIESNDDFSSLNTSASNNYMNSTFDSSAGSLNRTVDSTTSACSAGGAMDLSVDSATTSGTKGQPFKLRPNSQTPQMSIRHKGLLLDEIAKRPIIYDPAMRNPGERKNSEYDVAWREVQEAMIRHLETKAIKRVWRILVDRYRRMSREIVSMAAGKTKGKPPNWELYPKLERLGIDIRYRRDPTKYSLTFDASAVGTVEEPIIPKTEQKPRPPQQRSVRTPAPPKTPRSSSRFCILHKMAQVLEQHERELSAALMVDVSQSQMAEHERANFVITQCEQLYKALKYGASTGCNKQLLPTANHLIRTNIDTICDKVRSLYPRIQPSEVLDCWQTIFALLSSPESTDTGPVRTPCYRAGIDHQNRVIPLLEPFQFSICPSGQVPYICQVPLSSSIPCNLNTSMSTTDDETDSNMRPNTSISTDQSDPDLTTDNDYKTEDEKDGMLPCGKDVQSELPLIQPVICEPDINVTNGMVDLHVKPEMPACDGAGFNSCDGTQPVIIGTQIPQNVTDAPKSELVDEQMFEKLLADLPVPVEADTGSVSFNMDVCEKEFPEDVDIPVVLRSGRLQAIDMIISGGRPGDNVTDLRTRMEGCLMPTHAMAFGACGSSAKDAADSPTLVYVHTPTTRKRRYMASLSIRPLIVLQQPLIGRTIMCEMPDEYEKGTTLVCYDPASHLVFLVGQPMTSGFMFHSFDARALRMIVDELATDCVPSTYMRHILNDHHISNIDVECPATLPIRSHQLDGAAMGFTSGCLWVATFTRGCWELWRLRSVQKDEPDHYDYHIHRRNRKTVDNLMTSARVQIQAHDRYLYCLINDPRCLCARYLIDDDQWYLMDSPIMPGALCILPTDKVVCMVGLSGTDGTRGTVLMYHHELHCWEEDRAYNDELTALYDGMGVAA